MFVTLFIRFTVVLLMAAFTMRCEAVTRLIPFQGHLTKPVTSGTSVIYNVVPDGSYTIHVNLYPAPAGGTPAWGTETHPNVPVVNGLVNIMLGNITPFPSTPGFFSKPLYVGVTIDDNNPLTPAEPELVPRQVLLPGLYAHEAGNASLLNGQPASFYNSPPVAILNASPLRLSAFSQASTVTLDLGASYDPEGLPLEFGFDPMGNKAGQPVFGTTAILQFTYPSTPLQSYQAEGWVRDAAGLVNRATVLIEFTNSVTADSITVDSTGSVGMNSSLAVVNGNPAMSYYDSTNHSIKFVRASDAIGSAWGAPVTVVTSVNSITMSLAYINEKPAIAYPDANSNSLRYVRASDTNGTSWPASITVETNPPGIGREPSMTTINGNPAISYNDPVNGQLKFCRAMNANGTSWGPNQILDTGTVGRYSSLGNINGPPAVAYFDGSVNRLKYIRAIDSDGAEPVWSKPSATAINANGGGGAFASLIIANNVTLNGASGPVIAYRSSSGALMYVRASTPDGTGTWQAPIVVDPILDANLDSGNVMLSMKLTQNRPAIAYYDSINGDLKFVRSLDDAGTVWSAPLTLDSTGDVGQWPSLADIEGQPAISYFDATNGDLKYVR